MFPYAADFKLADLLGIAGATIGIIIAAAILMGGFHAKYLGLFERYRALTGEYRGDGPSDPRRGSLRAQIPNYRRRMNFLSIAGALMSVAVLLFILVVAVASVSVAYPHVLALRTVGTIGLILGLALIAGAVALDLRETLLSRQAIGQELEDFSDLPD